MNQVITRDLYQQNVNTACVCPLTVCVRIRHASFLSAPVHVACRLSAVASCRVTGQWSHKTQRLKFSTHRNPTMLVTSLVTSDLLVVTANSDHY